MADAVSTDQAPRPAGFYSQGIRDGRLVFVSGQLPLDREGRLVGGTARAQAEQALKNVSAILSAAGGRLQDLVQVTIYVSDIGQWGEVNTAYKEFLKEVRIPPARAVVPVKDLHYGAMVEIQAIASLPAARRRRTAARPRPSPRSRR